MDRKYHTYKKNKYIKQYRKDFWIYLVCIHHKANGTLLPKFAKSFAVQMYKPLY